MLTFLSLKQTPINVVTVHADFQATGNVTNQELVASLGLPPNICQSKDINVQTGASNLPILGTLEH
jgi:hypothetical protein